MELSIASIYKQKYLGRRVSIDSRDITGGELFIAIKGEHHDGNRYALTALEKGADFAIIDDATLYVEDKRLVLVQDGLKTLQALASFHRQSLNIPVIGITGSNGKTTTKELLLAVLSAKFDVAATKGNFNNHIGLPLTLLATRSNVDILILEMGTNQPGDIQLLCEIGDPTHGVITNIGDAHLEKLIDRKGVLNEKGALYNHVIQSKKGMFFIHMDDELLRLLEGDSKYAIHYGSDTSSSITSVNSSSQGDTVELVIQNQALSLSTNMSGHHNAENILTAAVIGHYFDVTFDDIAKGIECYIPSNMRSQVKTTDRNTLLIEAYNANPSSMEASIRAALTTHTDLVLILGDMLELGTKEIELHKSVLALIDKSEAQDIILVGPLFTKVGHDRYKCYQNVDTLISSGALGDINNANVLIKASRGIRLEKVLDYL